MTPITNSSNALLERIFSKRFCSCEACIVEV
jgi:hypothetical protein